MTTGAEALGLYTPNNTLHGEKWSERKRKTYTQDKMKQKTKNIHKYMTYYNAHG